LFPATSDLVDDAHHELITAYAVKRPDGEWSLLMLNKDPSNAHILKIEFDDGAKTPLHFTGAVKVATFGEAEYVWHSDGAKSYADPDGPPKRTTVEMKPEMTISAPKASIVVATGKVE